MKKPFYRILPFYFSLIFISVGISLAQTKMSKWNFSYQFDPTNFLSCQYKTLNASDSVKIYLKLTFDVGNRKFKNLNNKEYWPFEYRISASYESKNSLYSNYVWIKRRVLASNQFLFEFSVPKINSSSAYLFIVTYQDDDDGFIQDIPLRVLGKDLFADQIFFINHDTPLFDTYVTKPDTLYFSNAVSNEPVSIGYYKFNFQQANPPMSVANANDTDIKLVKDSIFNINTTEQFLVTKKGIYSIANEGRVPSNILAVENKFPKVSKVRELIDPIIYIASDDERRALKVSAKPKARLDGFWMDLGQDKDFARKMIKNYYHKVEEANALFTLHKEGWKSDRGMVYIIFGIPDEVFRNDVKEVWNFKKRPNMPSVRFVFYKKINAFDDYFYELQNSPDYANIWYNTVELWRKGILEK